MKQMDSPDSRIASEKLYQDKIHRYKARIRRYEAQLASNASYHSSNSSSPVMSPINTNQLPPSPPRVFIPSASDHSRSTTSPSPSDQRPPLHTVVHVVLGFFNIGDWLVALFRAILTLIAADPAGDPANYSALSRAVRARGAGLSVYSPQQNIPFVGYRPSCDWP